MENEKIPTATSSPLIIRCSNCGMPAEFNIIQKLPLPELRLPYRHPETDRRYPSVARTGKEKQKKASSEYPSVVYHCPQCGASVMVEKGEALAQCAFCSTSLVRQEYANAGQDLPELLIPFKITHEEAVKKLKAWVEENKDQKEARSIQSKLKELGGWYLPYQLAYGPVRCSVTRENSNREYKCGGYIDGVAVNQSSQLDNELMNEAEPFDWADAVPFEWGYLAGQKVKIQDATQSQVDQRTKNEIEKEYLHTVEYAMQTQGVYIQADISNTLTIPALMPMYYLRCSKKISATVNGQTGKVAVSRHKVQKKRLYLVEPFILTLIVAFLWTGIPFGAAFDMNLFLMGTIVSAIIIFSILTQDRTTKIRRLFFTKADTTQIRQKKENTPVFFEPVKGKGTPVRIHFYTPKRIIRYLFTAIAIITLPAWIAALIASLEKYTTEEILHLPYHYGMAWYALSIPYAWILWLKLGRSTIYNYPVIKKILPNGKYQTVQSDHTVPKIKISTLIRYTPKWLLLLIICILLGSIGAIL